MMAPMRPGAAVLLAACALAACALAGCKGPGYLMALREDKADRVALLRILAREPTDRAFAARGLLARPWTRLWVFGDRATAQGIEDRIALPFPRTDQPVARGGAYLVWTDATAVVSAFTVPAPQAASFAALRHASPIPPGRVLVLRGGRPRVLATR